ncbi:long-chain acyl-CoA synthetase [Sporobacter termitidis DSM 10068]|uniref:Long-chain acyl-CoA synthetase n=1 Tax=Sporobacter termitidis DSM 10068 TaxID=1123282 RepID=A0A1M5Z6Q3_9FIRM|nr:AMP-binding protein [Sporobacter termitidis]SHI19768.1 long-chain acyl-CoA synthetase [Sporobacter termitidis DSM 10068]
MNVNAPWLRHYGNVPQHLDYPDCSMAGLVLEAVKKSPDTVAYDFFSTRATYGDFAEKIDRCARALAAMGIGPGQRVTICMPNTPQAVVMFYALNLIGAVANMVHPLSAEEELVFYINSSKSTAALTLDQFYPKFSAIMARTSLRALIVAGVDDGLGGLRKPAYRLTKGRKIKRVKTGGKVIRWGDFIRNGESYGAPYIFPGKGDDLAAILYSGGTSGRTKGILLTNLNFNALAMQTAAAGNCIVPGHVMLAIMPVFHGFGLGVCIHTMFISGVSGILVPQFSVASYAALLKKYKPHYIAGVPTLFEALLRIDKLDGLDMSQLEGVFSGGDSLSIELKRKVDAFLKAHGARVQIREGYGLTESVTANCLTPRDFHKEGSIGIPYPDMFFKIVRPGTQEMVPYGEVGEICITGPTLMKGYAESPEETAQVLQTHPDGRRWLHTGDLGSMDEDGFVYFRQRLKRMIISSGYSIYPSQIENVIDAHEKVLTSCVIGVPDPYKMQKVKAFVVLRDGEKATDEIKASILAHCKKNIAKYALPYEIEYRDALPKTLVGKVAYTVLEQEEADKLKASGE